MRRGWRWGGRCRWMRHTRSVSTRWGQSVQRESGAGEGGALGDVLVFDHPHFSRAERDCSQLK